MVRILRSGRTHEMDYLVFQTQKVRRTTLVTERSGHTRDSRRGRLGKVTKKGTGVPQKSVCIETTHELSLEGV